MRPDDEVISQFQPLFWFSAAFLSLAGFRPSGSGGAEGARIAGASGSGLLLVSRAPGALQKGVRH